MNMNEKNYTMKSNCWLLQMTNTRLLRFLREKKFNHKILFDKSWRSFVSLFSFSQFVQSCRWFFGKSLSFEKTFLRLVDFLRYEFNFSLSAHFYSNHMNENDNYFSLRQIEESRKWYSLVEISIHRWVENTVDADCSLMYFCSDAICMQCQCKCHSLIYLFIFFSLLFLLWISKIVWRIK